jgi:transcriptional regulator with XRE-family HTH domain
MTQSSSRGRQAQSSTLRERLLFVVWLGGKILGAENSKQFAEVIGKGAPQLSKWINEDPRPSWENIKLIADAVRIDPVWLDAPTRENAVEPTDFAQWIGARREREGKKSRVPRGA